MGSPRFGFSVTPGSPIAVGEEMRFAEEAGYSRIGVWDSPALFREPWMTLASVARDTRHLRIGTWVSNPISRHPVVTASSIATIEDLAPGRTYFGIGTGGTGVWHLGHRSAGLEDLREYVTAVRRLLRDGRATYRDAECRMEWGRGVSVPIIMSAHGPRSLRLAGEIADGVVATLGISPDVVAGCLELIGEGAHSAGRTLADLEVWFTCFWFVDEQPGAALAEGAWAATAFALHFSRGRVDGRVVTPGGIEAHAHIHEPMYRGWSGGGDVWLQPPEGATRAAAHGGTTTVLSFAFLDVHMTDRAFDTTEAVDRRKEIFSGRSFVDYAFHPVITGSASPETPATIGTAVEGGTPSSKVFNTDVTTGQSGIRIDHGSALAAMRIAREAGGSSWSTPRTTI